MGNFVPDKSYYPNLDFIRYLLSIAVIIAHINILAGYDFYFPVTSFEAVGGFFALSGFLMYPNYMRHNNVLRYTRQRARRILPPYFLIVILCAFSFVTISSCSASGYFLSREWWKYLISNLTFLNWLQPSLPGVFEGSEYFEPAVNGSLWTMKVEWCLYFSVPLFVWLLCRLPFSKKNLCICIILLSIAYRIGFTYLYDLTDKKIYEILARQIFGQLAYFYCGMYIYFCKESIARHYLIVLAAGIILYAISSINWISQCLFNPMAIAAIIMSTGFLPYNINFLNKIPNISYEMYLFHYPFIQLSVYFGLNHGSAIGEFAFVFAATIILSILSATAQPRLLRHLS